MTTKPTLHPSPCARDTKKIKTPTKESLDNNDKNNSKGE
jgi:hypothetical protein